MRVFLVGFMGAGKTTVGRLLAQELGLPFIDLDGEVEAADGRTVPEIFGALGERGFRELEHAALRAVLRRPPAVIATGGGLPAEDRNQALLREAGTVVWLDVPFDIVRERLDRSGEPLRPLFREPESAQQLFEARLPVYRRADLRISVSPEDTPAVVAKRVADRLGGRPCAT